MKQKRLLFLSCLIFLWWMYPGNAFSQAPSGQRYEVLDGQFNTLKEKVEEANQNPGSTIYISSSITFEEELIITSSMTIEGSDKATVALNTDDFSRRLFTIKVDDGVTIPIEVTIKNITLEGGKLSGEENGGVFLLVNEAYEDPFDEPENFPIASDFYLDNVIIKNSKAYRGGVLFTEGGWNLHIKKSDFENNQADIAGGVIYGQGRYLSVTDGSRFISNKVGQFDFQYLQFGGGAIFFSLITYSEPQPNIPSVTLFDNCIFDSNQAYGYDGSDPDYRPQGCGGAVYLEHNDLSDVQITIPQVIFNDVTFIKNEATSNGGAISSSSLLLDITGTTTFEKNTAGLLEGSTCEMLGGGAIYMDLDACRDCYEGNDFDNFRMNFSDVTFTDNRTLKQGGAIHSNVTGIPLNLSNTIFDKNRSGENGGAIVHMGFSIIDDNSKFTNNTAGYLNEGESTDYGCDDACCAEGGAVYFWICCADEQMPLSSFSNSVFTENKAIHGGGAISGYADGSGLELIHAAFNKNNAKEHGGAIHLNIANLLIDDTKFEDNFLLSTDEEIDEMKGGAVYLQVDGCCSETVGIKVIYSSFEGNYAEYNNVDNEDIQVQGGAFYIGGDFNGKADIIDTDFLNNSISLTAKDGIASGGAIASMEIPISVQGKINDYSIFRNNSVNINISSSSDCCEFLGGGAISVYSDLQTIYTLFDLNKVNIESQSSDISKLGAGAVGMMASGSGDRALEFKKTTFSNNKVVLDAPNAVVMQSGGGAIHGNGSQLVLEESTLIGNEVEFTSNELLESGGGAIYYENAPYGYYIVNTTITGNKLILNNDSEKTGGAGIVVGDYTDMNIINSILVGNLLTDVVNNRNKEIEDIYIIKCCDDEEEEDDDEYYNLKLGYSTYQVINGGNWMNVQGKISDITDVFGGEPTLRNDHTIKISETGKAALYGTFVGRLLHDNGCDECHEKIFVYYFRQGDKWYKFQNECESIFEPVVVADFKRNDISGNYGLSVIDDECYDEPAKGEALVIAQNNVNRLAYNHSQYNAGAHALVPFTPEPEPDPKVSLQWSVRTSDSGAFTDVANGITTTVNKPGPVYVQIRPIVEEGVTYDSWIIEYSAAPTNHYYSISSNLSSTERYDFNNGGAHTEVGNYAYTVTSVSIFNRGSLVVKNYFTTSSYTHNIIIKEDKDPTPPDPDPDPEWPPVLPEDPDDPDPNPNAWVIIHPLAPYCYTEEYLVVTFDLLNKQKPLEYAVAFTDKAKAAGFKDISTYKDLPKDGVITIPVNGFIPKGTYHGYLVLREKGSKETDLYPFKIEVVEYVKIVKHPESVSHLCEGDEFTLSVETAGDVLSYQWYFNREKIVGATTDTYSNVISGTTIGDYYAKVTGYCNVDSSDVAHVGQNAFRTLLKWDDVLYVTNLDNRFVKFQWYKNGQAVTTYGNAIYYTDPEGLLGSYYLRAYTSETQYIESCPIDFPIHTRGTSIAVYPSPVNKGEYITVESNEVGESYIGAQIDLYDLSGRKVYNTIATSPKVQIPMSVASGVYMVQIKHQSGKVTTHKVIVK